MVHPYGAGQFNDSEVFFREGASEYFKRDIRHEEMRITRLPVNRNRI
jgi:hypothetical protein